MRFVWPGGTLDGNSCARFPPPGGTSVKRESTNAIDLLMNAVIRADELALEPENDFGAS